VVSSAGRDAGELRRELPFRAHEITAPRRRSERVSLEGLWVTEGKNGSLLNRISPVHRFPVFFTIRTPTSERRVRFDG
jgi:hypothetical protein